jgi:hypothetical protein
VREAAFEAVAAVGNEIDLEEAGLRLLPVGEGANRDAV